MPRFFTLASSTLALLGVSTALHADIQTYAPDDLRLITNPERGLYAHYESQSEQNPLSLSSLNNIRGNGMTMVLRLYYLKSFRDQPLSQAQLDLISNDFATMRQAGVKGVLRFAYSQGTSEPDAPLNVVLNHMDQLAPILQANADVIATAQAGFAGAWGEWHGSSNNLTSPANARQIVDKWLDSLPEDRAIQIRTPALKWMLLNDGNALTESEAFTGTDKARIGHHNDCFLASSTDFGTYANPAAEKAWLNLETQYLPMGGETCAVSYRSDSATARTEMQQMHYSYLNSGYHAQVLADWQADGFLDEVKRNLGYRFSLTQADYESNIDQGEALSIDLELQNTGWASPYNPRDVVLTMVSDDGLVTFSFELDEDPRTWLPGEAIEIAADLNLPTDAPTGDYHLFFSLPDPTETLSSRPEYAIQLANPGLWDQATGRHDLGITITINAPLPGDLNGDGFVGVDDLNTVLVNWNQVVAPGDAQSGDATGEGYVGVDDLNIVLINWNNGTPPTDRGVIPEPTVFTMLLFGISSALSTRPTR